MHVNIVYQLTSVTTFLMDEALLSISPAGRGQLVRMIITLEPHCIFETNFACLYTLTGMQNGDETSPSIISAGQGLVFKMLITLEPHGIF